MSNLFIFVESHVWKAAGWVVRNATEAIAAQLTGPWAMKYAERVRMIPEYAGAIASF